MAGHDGLGSVGRLPCLRTGEDLNDKKLAAMDRMMEEYTDRR